MTDFENVHKLTSEVATPELGQSNNDVILSIGDIMSHEPYEGGSWLDLAPPGVPLSRRYIEDDDPEWRELNYDIEVERRRSMMSKLRKYHGLVFRFRSPQSPSWSLHCNMIMEFI